MINKKIVISTIIALSLIGCGDTKENNVEEKVTQVQESIKSTTESVAQNVKSATDTIAQSTKETISTVSQKTEQATQSAEDVVSKVVEKTKETVATVAKKVEDKAKDIKTASTQKSPAQLYVKCASCHGQKAEKSALAKSEIIANWDETKIKDALMGYKNGTYGGMMKSLMQTQIKGYSDSDLEAVAKYITTLK
jgi:cytochrome c553